MCVRNADEGCILLERMSRVEGKLGIVIFLFSVLIAVLSFFSIKLLNAQLLLINGVDGLRAIGAETRHDFHAISQETSK